LYSYVYGLAAYGLIAKKGPSTPHCWGKGRQKGRRSEARKKALEKGRERLAQVVEGGRGHDFVAGGTGREARQLFAI
jgi:hypothetical protein